MTKTVTVERASLCICGKRLSGTLDICESCLEKRQSECLSNYDNPNFKPRNPACNYGWHAVVIDCPLCISDGIYGTKGCKPCEKCHYCNLEHKLLEAMAHG